MLLIIFVDEEMDGLAIVIAFGSQSGPDCLQSVVKRCGYRLKVYNFLKSLMVYEFQEVRSDIIAPKFYLIINNYLLFQFLFKHTGTKHYIV